MRSVRLTISNLSRLFLAVVAVSCFSAANAQENSPFSRYGLGEFYSNQHIISRSMGGLTAAYVDGGYVNVGQSVNFSNPATYGRLFNSTLDLGVTIDSRTLRSASPVGKFSSTNFIPSYLALGVPLNRVKGWGMAFGLKPQSRINYSVQSLERTAGDTLQTLYEGTGGLNQAFIGIGKAWENLSIGINTGYNFGRKEISTKKNFVNDTVSYYSSNSSTTTNFGGLFLSGGVQYEAELSKKTNTLTNAPERYLLRFGLTGTLQQNMGATMDVDRKTYAYSASGAEFTIDSVFSQKDIKGKILLPATYAVGITLHKTIGEYPRSVEMWSVGAEYTSTQWTKYRFFDQADRLANSWQFKLGAQFAPNPFATRGYWNTVNYRAGIYIGKDYLDADGRGLKQMGVSFGAGLPIRKYSYNDQSTVINLALQLGKRGSSVNNVTENYLQFSLGFSLSDTWFVKRRYD